MARTTGVTEENLQSRLRGVTLMALSNKWGALVLTTGNKSELAVGYCTLYGDMCGGLAVISDVPKTLVYSLSRVANQRHAERHSRKTCSSSRPPPSCGPIRKIPIRFRPTTCWTRFCALYREQRRAAADRRCASSARNSGAGHCQQSGSQRIQAPAGRPGLKVTTKAFGIGRRFPIAQRFSE